MNDIEQSARLEGILFAVGKPLSRIELTTLLGIDAEALERSIKLLSAQQGRGVIVVDDGTQIELRVASSAAELVERVRTEELARDIGRAGLEVLAAVLYRGPLSRADIDFIRGVNSSATLRTLTMRGLIRRTTNPKDPSLSAGRRGSFLYEPTTELFASLGATHARDLPDFEEVREKLLTLEASYRNSATES